MSQNWLDRDLAKGLAGTAGRTDIPAIPGGTSAPDPFLGLKQAAEMASREIRGIPSKRYVIPEGMLEAVRQGMRPILEASSDRNHGYNQDDLERAGIEGILRWISENPRVPSDADLDKLMDEACDESEPECNSNRYVAVNWQRRMFLAPEPEEICPTCGLRQDNRIGVAPEAIRDVLAWFDVWCGKDPQIEDIKRNVITAYRRGREGI